jgi:hypothetical protein
MGFETDLVAKQVADFHWELVQPLEYRGNSELFVVPIGSSTDYASVPKIFQWLIPRSGRYTRAAVLHDYLWSSGKCSLADADGIFRKAMAELGVPFLRRWTMWAAVRIASLAKSGLQDGPKDIPRVLLLLLIPGGVVIPGGLVVLVFLLGFWIVELIVAGVVGVLRRSPIPTRRLKPANWPTVFWSR